MSPMNPPTSKARRTSDRARGDPYGPESRAAPACFPGHQVPVGKAVAPDWARPPAHHCSVPPLFISCWAAVAGGPEALRYRPGVEGPACPDALAAAGLPAILVLQV